MLGTGYGLDPEKLLNAIANSSGNSNAIKNFTLRPLKSFYNPPSFALDLAYKDLHLALELGTLPTDLATTSAYDRAFLRFSDGTNGSPYVEVRVVSLLADQNPGGSSDGLPDDWVALHFGSASASVNPNADADGDGVSNLNEFRLGTDPTNASSVLRFTSGTTAGLNWLATPYEVYEVQGTTNFTNWFRVGNPIVPTTTNGSFTNFPAVPRMFFRIERVP